MAVALGREAVTHTGRLHPQAPPLPSTCNALGSHCASQPLAHTSALRAPTLLQQLCRARHLLLRAASMPQNPSIQSSFALRVALRFSAWAPASRVLAAGMRHGPSTAAVIALTGQPPSVSGQGASRACQSLWIHQFTSPTQPSRGACSCHTGVQRRLGCPANASRPAVLRRPVSLPSVSQATWVNKDG